jgi:hypothetical protein
VSLWATHPQKVERTCAIPCVVGNFNPAIKGGSASGLSVAIVHALMSSGARGILSVILRNSKCFDYSETFDWI